MEPLITSTRTKHASYRSRCSRTFPQVAGIDLARITASDRTWRHLAAPILLPESDRAGSPRVDRELEAKARALAGLKGYITNLAACPDGTPVNAEFVIAAYHRLFEIEKSFRMSKHDLQARPIYHHQRDSIEAHLSIVFTALAVSRWIEARTGWSIRKFVRTTRRYRTIEIRAGDHTITAADPLPGDLHDALDRIHRSGGAH
jgi:hypothetical protein